ncbi:hypothetical protein CHU98_g11094 [Xylaria longipes]|nr:hypothetical protein CHU98_g11094 [Xylaria longipes]
MSAPRRQLVQGGHIYISQTPPTIHPHSYILAAAHPTIDQADPAIDGWVLSDFYAFNYLFKGIGSGQKWLTAADPYDVLKRNGKHGEVLLHGNPYQDRKVVLSEDLIAAKELVKPIVVKQNDMVQRFLKEAKEVSELAKKKNVPLVLLVFCHGLPGYELMLDTNKGLSATTLKGHLEPGAQVTLITTACYSGGWVINPDFNNTAIAAAGMDEPSISQPLSDSLGRVCGSVFASSFIKTLASTASPLIESTTQGWPAVARGMRDSQASSELQPESPNEQQTLTYNAFCRAVWDSCKQLTRLYSDHSLSFSAHQDQWGHTWTGLAGIPVAHYEKRWRRLQTVRYLGSHEKKASLDQDPSNTTFGGVAPSAATGGAADTFGKEIIESMRKHQVQEMARIFREKACPDDWNQGWNVGYGGVLQSCAKGERPNKLSNPNGWHEEIEVVASIQFRWQMGLLTDLIIKNHGLPVPNGEHCLFWHERTWKQEIEKGIPNWRDRKTRIAERLRLGGFIFRPRPEQGPVWIRPWSYLSAAIVQANLPKQETMKLIDKILFSMQKFEEFEEQRFISGIIEDPHVWVKGRDWLQSVGRRIRGYHNRRSCDNSSRQIPNLGSPSRKQ